MAKSFRTDLLPLFRAIDIGHMKPHGVLLDDYVFMSNARGDGKFPDHANARRVFDSLATEWMPLGGPYWSAEQLSSFQQWMDDGFQP